MNTSVYKKLTLMSCCALAALASSAYASDHEGDYTIIGPDEVGAVCGGSDKTLTFTLVNNIYRYGADPRIEEINIINHHHQGALSYVIDWNDPEQCHEGSPVGAECTIDVFFDASDVDCSDFEDEDHDSRHVSAKISVDINYDGFNPEKDFHVRFTDFGAFGECALVGPSIINTTRSGQDIVVDRDRCAAYTDPDGGIVGPINLDADDLFGPTDQETIDVVTDARAAYHNFLNYSCHDTHHRLGTGLWRTPTLNAPGGTTAFCFDQWPVSIEGTLTLTTNNEHDKFVFLVAFDDPWIDEEDLTFNMLANSKIVLGGNAKAENVVLVVVDGSAELQGNNTLISTVLANNGFEAEGDPSNLVGRAIVFDNGDDGQNPEENVIAVNAMNVSSP
jgi:hypothetical protein